MAQVLREPVNIVSKYLRSSPVRSRPPGSPNRHHGTLAPPHLAKFHENRAVREEQEESDSDIEVFGPFLASKKVETKPEAKTAIVAGVAKVATDSEHSPGFRQLHQFFLDETSISASRVNKPTSISSTSTRTSSSTLTNRARKPAQKLAEMALTTSTTFVTSLSAAPEPPIHLPAYSYKDYTDPKAYVAYTRDVDEANDLIAALKPGPVAFDMEWCFSIARKTKVRRTAVIQIADSAGLVVIVHLSAMPRFPKALQALLENPEIPKLGANIMADGKKLFRDYGVLAKNLLELAALAVAWDPAHTIKRKITSLAKLTETYCGKALGKGAERTSNWEVPELSELQKHCNILLTRHGFFVLTCRALDAANDVHCSMEIYKRLRSLAAPTALDIPAGGDVAWYLPKDIEEADAGGEQMRLQWRRAHRLWHDTGMALEKMCAEMRVRKEGVPDEGPLKTSTEYQADTDEDRSYVIYALQADPKLPFDIEKLRRLVLMDGSSWMRHRRWLIERALEMQVRLVA
ncbi:hypothetical protein C0993_004333 [Termitomyces sp. T159_Od127]|nr:hypothetical protein C0993_004333 [Termitomyces sp. T159_Od127]